jgi:hypothetical protein
MAKAKPMTVSELYDFAKEHGFEDAQICFPSGTNAITIFEDAKLEVQARMNEDDEAPKRIYLIG